MTQTHRAWIIAIVLWVLLQVVLQIGAASDFYAVYFAGKSFAMGDFASVYGPPVEMFSLDAPTAWTALAAELGLDPEMPLYPYIYPPIWAAVSSVTLSQIAPGTVLPIINAVNAALFIGTVALAWRVTRTQQDLVIWLLVGVLMLASTTFGFIPLRQGQHQAGIALAFAASIKLYPLLLLVLWLARRDQWRNIPAFVATIIAISVASVTFAGADLHMQFFDRIAAISGSVRHTMLSYNFAVQIEGWAISALPEDSRIKLTTPWVNILSKLLLLTSAAAAFWAARRATPDQFYRCIVPIWLVAMSYFSPLSWSYHFLTAMAFAPLLLQNRAGTISYAAIFVVTFIGSAMLVFDRDPTGMILVCAGTVALLILVTMLIRLRPQNGRTTLPE